MIIKTAVGVNVRRQGALVLGQQRSVLSGRERRSRLFTAHAQGKIGVVGDDELVEFLREDLQHLFDDQGIDVTKYEDSVQFEDPITKYTTIDGYIKNIQFLKNVFNPTFILRDIKRTNEYEIAFRWTMYMTPVVPFLGTLTFTGTSRLGISPDSGKFNRHIDTWDSIKEQRYFSIEAFVHMLGQLVPGSGSYHALAPYTVLVKRKEYEIREYEDGTVYCDFYSNPQHPKVLYSVMERDGLQKYLKMPRDKSITNAHVLLENFRLSEYLPLTDATSNNNNV